MDNSFLNLLAVATQTTRFGGGSLKSSSSKYCPQAELGLTVLEKCPPSSVSSKSALKLGASLSWTYFDCFQFKTYKN